MDEQKESVETMIDLSDLTENSDSFLIIDLRTVQVCNKCHSKISYRKTEKYISMRCGCGCRVWYAKDSRGIIISTWVTKNEHELKRGNNAGNTNSVRNDD